MKQFHCILNCWFHHWWPWQVSLVVSNVWNCFLTQNLAVSNAFHCIWAVDSILASVWWLRNSCDTVSKPPESSSARIECISLHLMQLKCDYSGDLSILCQETVSDMSWNHQTDVTGHLVIESTAFHCIWAVELRSPRWPWHQSGG